MAGEINDNNREFATRLRSNLYDPVMSHQVIKYNNYKREPLDARSATRIYLYIVSAWLLIKLHRRRRDVLINF